MNRHDFDSPLPGVSIAFDVDGPDDAATTLLWLHGEYGPFGDPPVSDGVLDGVRVIVAHHPGWGVSHIADGATITRIDELATLYWWCLDELGIDRVVIAGHGFGGALGVEMAVQQPARVWSLALAAPLGLFDADDPGVDMFGSVLKDLLPALYADPTSTLAAEQFPNPPDAYERGLATIRRTEVIGATARFLFPFPDTGVARRLYRLADVPVRILWGGRDGVAPAGLAARWQEAIAHADIEVAPELGHMAPYEDRARMSRFLGDSLRIPADR